MARLLLSAVGDFLAVDPGAIWSGLPDWCRQALMAEGEKAQGLRGLAALEVALCADRIKRG